MKTTPRVPAFILCQRKNNCASFNEIQNDWLWPFFQPTEATSGSPESLFHALSGHVTYFSAYQFSQIMLIDRLEATQRRKFVWWFHSTASKAAFPKVSDTANPVNSLKRWRSWSSVCNKVSLTMLSAALAIFALSPSQKTNRTASKGGVSTRGQTRCFCFLLTFEVRREAFDSRTTSAGLARAFSLTGHVTSGSGGQYGKAAGTNHSHAAGRSRLA